MGGKTMIQRVATAINNADVGFSLELTRLVDGESTFKATIKSMPPQSREFTGDEAREDAYAWIESYRMNAKARAAVTAMRDPDIDMLVAGQETWMCYAAAEERGEANWHAMIDAALSSSGIGGVDGR